MKRKMIAICLSVIIGILPAVGFADSADEPNAAYRESIETLFRLDIYKGLYDDSVAIDPGQAVKRGEFALLMANLSGYAEKNADEPTGYADVKATDAYAGAVVQMTAAGILSGNGDGTFGAANTLIASEAMAGLVHVLGYRYRALQFGGYPAGYLHEARMLGVLDGLDVSLDAEVTQGMLAQMIDNALEIDIAKATAFSSSGAEDAETTYSVVPGKNILTEYLKLDVTEGILNATEQTALDTADGRTKEGYVKVGDMILKNGELSPSGSLGKNVKVYYEQNADKTLRYYKEKDNKELVVQSDDIKSFAGRQLTYEEADGSKVKHVSIGSDADVIYNGVAYPDYAPSDLLIKDGSLTLIDNNQDNRYEVVCIVEYQTAVVSAVSVTDERIYVDKPQSAMYDFAAVEDGNLRVFDKDGKPGSLSDIAVDMVISVMESKDHSCYTIYYNDETQTGTLTMFQDDLFEIDDIPKKVVPAFRDALRNLGIGYQGTFLFDAFQRVAQVEDNQSNQVLYGYFSDYHVENTFSPKISFRIFTQEGKMEEMSLAKKVKVDGVEVDGKSLATDSRFVIANGGNPYPNQRMVKFKKDGRGEISYLVTSDGVNSALLSQDEKLVRRSLEGISYKASSKIFSKTAFLTEKTMTFKVPMAPESDPSACHGFSEKAFTLNQLQLSDNQRYQNIDAFDIDEGGACKVVLYKEPYSVSDEIGGTAKPAENDPCVFVTDIAMTLDEDGLSVPVVSLFEKGAVNTYVASGENVPKKPLRKDDGTIVPDTYIYIEKGDVIRYVKDSNNKMTGMELIYDSRRKDAGQFKTCSGEASGYDIGRVYAKSNSGMRISATCTGVLTDGSYQFDFSEDKLITWKLADVTTSIYDRKTETAQTGSAVDLVTYKDNHQEASIVIVHSKYYETREVLILK